MFRTPVVKGMSECLRKTLTDHYIMLLVQAKGRALRWKLGVFAVSAIILGQVEVFLLTLATATCEQKIETTLFMQDRKSVV